MDRGHHAPKPINCYGFMLTWVPPSGAEAILPPSWKHTILECHCKIMISDVMFGVGITDTYKCLNAWVFSESDSPRFVLDLLKV